MAPDADEGERARRRGGQTAAAMTAGALLAGAAGKRAGLAAMGREGRDRGRDATRRFFDALIEDATRDPAKAAVNPGKRAADAYEDARRAYAAPRNLRRAGWVTGAYGGYRLTDPNRKRSE